MLKKLTRFYYPKTIEEACKFLAEADCKTKCSAGATSEALRNDNSIEALVDLTQIKELSYIKQDSQYIRIGAATPVQDIYKYDGEKTNALEVLSYAAGKIGSTLLRNSITAGGELAVVLPWSDLPPVYMVLDAEIVCRMGRPKRTVPVQTLIDTSASDFLRKNEIIAEIALVNYGKNTGFHFIKMAKTSNDYALISLAIRVTQKDKIIKDARVVASGLTKKPHRCSAAEQAIIGNEGTPELFAKAAKKAATQIPIRDDFRASKEYRKEVVEVLIRRGLKDAFEKAIK